MGPAQADTPVTQAALLASTELNETGRRGVERCYGPNKKLLPEFFRVGVISPALKMNRQDGSW